MAVSWAGADGQNYHGERLSWSWRHGHTERGSDDCRVGAEMRTYRHQIVAVLEMATVTVEVVATLEGGRGRSERGLRGQEGGGADLEGRRRRRGDRKGDDAGIVGYHPEIAGEGSMMKSIVSPSATEKVEVENFRCRRLRGWFWSGRWWWNYGRQVKRDAIASCCGFVRGTA